MVRNITGGSKSKGVARKHNNSNNNSNNNLRTSEDEGEIYAIVTKMCGNGMFQCYCMDEIERLCHIRGKFSGRKKRDNIVASGGWVLIGIRDWDEKPDNEKEKGQKHGKEKIQQCDLLEVYNDGDKDRLKENVQANWKILTSHDPHKIGDCDDDDDSGFKFTTDKDIERDKFLKEAQSETAEKIKLATVSDQLTAEDWISIDDL
jgi:initiation factor 1A